MKEALIFVSEETPATSATRWSNVLTTDFSDHLKKNSKERNDF